MPTFIPLHIYWFILWIINVVILSSSTDGNGNTVVVDTEDKAEYAGICGNTQTTPCAKNRGID